MKINTVLLVDDDPDDREIFCQTFEEIDPTIQCITKGSCAEAMTYLKARPDNSPDLVFLDLNLPAVNGMQCLERMKKLPMLQKIRVVIYTTSKNPEDIEVTKKMGAAFFITKQGRLKELKVKIQSILDSQ
jgi:CheY-like chemotaxis protein